ncbi:MAG: acyl-CoA dehydrogenase [Dongiaceae bacterium]
MPDFAAPLADIRFALDAVAGIESLAALPAFGEATPELVEQVLAEAGRFAGEVLAPLNRSGDIEGARLENGAVHTPVGFGDAHRQFAAGGWTSLPFDPAWGGQGLPWALATATQELWAAANLSFSLCGLLTQGAVEALQIHGSPEQQATYLPKLISGAWSGTMNLTEPQAGSDVGALRTKAQPAGDHYRITGQKIFITYGEQDFTENIIHLVLARTPGSPEGTKGISLFIVPKFLVQPDGSPGARNDLRCLSLEHKLGIRATPTCVMAYGEKEGAIGYLVGEERRGMEYMFTMMNNARLAVGIEGLAIGERALQQARDYARARIQGRDVAARDGGPVPIIRHPDVRRMLMTMRATVAAMRGIIYFTAATLDRAKHDPDPERRKSEQSLAELMTPIAKAWCTDRGVEVASLGIQVHGGVGFIESTGAAQHLRDSRIAPIYEGTNGIQAMDLVARKLIRDRGVTMRDLSARIEATCAELAQDKAGEPIAHRLRSGLDHLRKASSALLAVNANTPALAFAGAAPYLQLAGTVIGGWLLGREAMAAGRALARKDGDPGFLEARTATALFYAENIMPQAAGLAAAATSGAASVLAVPEERL